MPANSSNTSADPKPRLWIVCEVFFPEVTGTAYYLTTLAEGLADTFDIKVICGQPNYSKRGTKAPKHELGNGVEIFRVWSTTLDKNFILNRLINLITIGITVFWRAVLSFRERDKVLVATTPPNLPFLAAFAALLRGAHYIPLIHDVYPEGLIAVGGIAPKSLFAKALNIFNRWLFKHANKVIVVGRDMKELIAQKSDGLDTPICTIPNWAELNIVEPRPRTDNPLLEKLGLAEKFVLMHAGNIGRPNDIETIIECAEMLSCDERFHFLFVGDGAKKQWIEQEKTKHSLSNITLTGPMPREEQSVFLNACDISIITLIKGMWGAAMPSRTYNTLASGKPILAITEPGSELSLVIDEEKIGWHTPPGDAAALCDLLQSIIDHRDELPVMGEKARSAALAKYSPETAIEKYRSALS